MLDWLAASLSEEQQSPFVRDTQNACILAAAGSGKTRTLVHLLAADLAAGIPPSSIIAFTFTEKAASELLARVHMLAREHLSHVDLTGMFVGTIHSWCLKYLREQKQFTNASAIDELHVDSLVSRLYDWLEIEAAYGQPYPHGVEGFLKDVEIVYNEQLALNQVPMRVSPSIRRFFEVLEQNRMMTFGDMIRHTIEFLAGRGPVAELRALYVDEYQDVNPAQVALIKAMLPSDARLVVVGDDLQCIYNWRGSDVSRILRFPNEIPNASVHRLSTNWRARPGIVTLGNAVAEEIQFRDQGKTMQSGRSDPLTSTVHWISVDDEEAQVDAVVEIVRRFGEQGVPWRKVAILLRSVISWGEAFAIALERAGIPYYCPVLNRGGNFALSFVAPVLAWLRSEPQPPRNPAEEQVQEAAADALWKSAQPWVTADDAENVFWDSLIEWRHLIDEQKSSAYDVRGRLYDFLDHCGIRIAPGDTNLATSLSIVSQIIRSVEEIHRRRLAGQPRRTPRGVISEVYYALVRRYGDFGESMPIDGTVDGVLITTVHQSKGLEWPVVILPMLVKRRFPVQSRNHGTSFPDTVAARYGTSLEDEWRLFYVAATRAKERLFLIDPCRSDWRRTSVFVERLAGKASIRLTEIGPLDDNVFQIDQQDLADSDPPPVRVGLSDLLLYAECPYQFGLRRIVGLQPSVGDELGFGLGLHELIERRLEDGRQWSRSEIAAKVDEQVHLPYMSEGAEQRSKQAVANRLERLQRLGVLSGQVESEVMVEVLMDNGIVHGVIDGVQKNSDGSVTVRDWKSNVHDDLLGRYQRQLQFYAYALRLQNRDVAAADIIDVAASSDRQSLDAFPVDITAPAIDDLITLLQQSILGIRDQAFPARPSRRTCRSCDMNRLCAVRYADE